MIPYNYFQGQGSYIPPNPMIENSNNIPRSVVSQVINPSMNSAFNPSLVPGNQPNPHIANAGIPPVMNRGFSPIINPRVNNIGNPNIHGGLNFGTNPDLNMGQGASPWAHSSANTGIYTGQGSMNSQIWPSRPAPINNSHFQEYPQGIPMNPQPIRQQINITWGYIGDRGNFHAYSPNICNILENSFQKKQPTVTITADNQKQYVINLVKMTQQKLNYARGAIRTVKRIDQNDSYSAGPKVICWFWHVRDTTYKLFNPSECILLEDAYQNGRGVVILHAANNKRYQVDVRRMEQVNVETGKIRKIRRGKA